MIVAKELLDALRLDLKHAIADAKKWKDSDEYVDRIRLVVVELESESNTIKPSKKMKFQFSFSGDGKRIYVTSRDLHSLSFEVDNDDVDEVDVISQLIKMLSILEENW